MEITLGVVNWGPDVKKGFRGSKTMLSMDRQAVVPCSSHAELRLRAQRPPRPLGRMYTSLRWDPDPCPSLGGKVE